VRADLSAQDIATSSRGNAVDGLVRRGVENASIQLQYDTIRYVIR